MSAPDRIRARLSTAKALHALDPNGALAEYMVGRIGALEDALNDAELADLDEIAEAMKSDHACTIPTSQTHE